ESLTTADGVQRWANASERGARPASPPGFYVSLTGAPEEQAMLARALLAAPGHALDLLPAGRAAIERRGELVLRRRWSSVRAIQYAISGLDFAPTPIWLEPDGTMFAQVQGWAGVVREGWEESLDTLMRVQQRADGERLAAIASRLAERKPGALVFEHARLFD